MPSQDETRAVVQEAVDATSTAYTEDASIDVAARLRQEIDDRGFEIDDTAWLEEVAHAIRSGHGVTVDATEGSDETRPGSLGGDNGGG